jgi:hypothetical protein
MRRIANFNIVGRSLDARSGTNGLWQNSKISAVCFNSNLPSVMDFTLHDALGSVLMKIKAEWDKGMITLKFYDNFTMEVLYPNVK